MIQPGYSMKMGNERVSSCPLAHVTVDTYEGFEALSWMLTFTGDGTTRISELWDCDVELPLARPLSRVPGCRYHDGSTKIVAMKGCDGYGYDGREGEGYNTSSALSAQEFRLYSDFIDIGGHREYACAGGRSSDGTMPFFEINQGDEGYFVCVGWTGGWKAVFTRTESGVRVQAGLKQTGFVLDEGETVRTARILILAYHQGSDDGAVRFRRLITRHFNILGRVGFCAYESWGGLTSDTITQRLRAIQAHGIRCDMSWLDAGWHGDNPVPSTGNFDPEWAKYTGDWRINLHAHPDGLQDVRDASEAAGMGMMLWFEPERVVASVPDVKAHPQWYLEWPDADKGNPYRNVILNLGNPEALENLYETLCGHIERLRLKVYRQDFNTDPEKVWAAADEGNVGITQIRHINNLYRLWDRLRERFPGLIIDDCASGGRRIDIEALTRAVPFFRSDYQCVYDFDPNVTQAQHVNLSRYLPAHGANCKIVNDTYAARSSYSACWGVAMWAIMRQQMPEENMAWLRERTDEYREIAPFYMGDFYNLGSATCDDTAWAVYEYTLDGEALVLSFRREHSPMDRAVIQLKGLEKGVRYRAVCRDSGEEIPVDEEGRMTLAMDRPYLSRIIRISPCTVGSDK